VAGDGTISGLMPSNAKVPAMPTSEDSRNPGFDLSTKYHNTGFARARVKETCSVDCQGSFLMAKAMPTNAPILRTTGFQSAPNPLLKRPDDRSSSSLSDPDEEALRRRSCARTGCFVTTLLSHRQPHHLLERSLPTVLNTTWNLLNLSRMRPSGFGHGLQAFFFAVVFALETLAEGSR